MADTESLRQIAHSRAPLSTWLGIVLLFALFGVIVLAVIGPTPRGSDYEEIRAKKRMENLKTAHEDAEKALNTYAWIDKNKGIARIPIDRAMELTVAELAQQKPAPAGPIATPGPEAPAGGPASPAPAGSPGAAPPGPSPSTQTPASPSPPAQQSPAPTSSPPAASPSPTPSKAP